MNQEPTAKANHISEVLDLIDQLRDPVSGCPWDRAQNFNSLRPYLLEECHEFLEALETWGPDSAETQEELGDLLYQIIFYSQLFKENGMGDFNSITQNLIQKLKNRHPHVFDPNFPRFKNAAEVSANWEKIKAYAKSGQDKKGTEKRPAKPLSKLSVAKHLPALQRATRMGEKAACFDFDWPHPNDVFNKINEEIQELKHAITESSADNVQEEFGDLLFAVTQLGRKLSLDSELCPQKACQKFESRFQKLEQKLNSQGQELDGTQSLEDLERIWAQIKKGL